MTKVPVQLTLNGEERAEFIDSGTTLLRLLRDKMGDLTPKAGCLQGTCGTCTVLIDGEPRLACVTLAEDCVASAVETVAGLAGDGRLHPLQQAFLDHFAAQCGFCTPGMLMAAKALLDGNPRPSRADVVEALGGNICRCTGYEPIIQAVLSVGRGNAPHAASGERA
jgi:carbon-monoxide dehydrogenase small subunit